jgi:hypothetical protein
MNLEEQRAAVATYKERKVTAGLYSFTCATTGQRWVGRAPDLSTIRSRQEFTLRLGSNPHASLQRAWRAHGTGSFSFDEVERLEDVSNRDLRDALLRKRQKHWCAELGAEAI